MQLSDVLSLLSTFGGAYSSLGDKYKSCAKTAGIISLKQLRIAFRLGDPITVHRCKVYFCISLIQTHKYNDAKRILLDVYNRAKNESSEIYDDKLVNMCKGRIGNVIDKLQLRRLGLKSRRSCHDVEYLKVSWKLSFDSSVESFVGA
ncbi:hypothetical protein QYM36_012328 [Artemia franciscana]|uniref:Uncharacterized protein n=1 Tax=Artemia franciscana TaxID=6661 RepID=A0AA88HUM3_ARTSF|nr:hypothetical protein QYM36_012328 [Artemia franciscana]